ncbi:LOW QUALITY PROTEIN: dnaJ homolog subfamily C member 4 [Dromiciops gliroides]|uniref:LOW QUALITY PROTEIN: dnaJ homolog subfamily C member 4 n=1 Tax=Dromiciops gliroides TaxID=33562 RepID=UPI001CC52259|nr:LOW QUALITY PROTEIN: dnaJ homolog subfamily C member 4 [Dromiciops gliroides]
MLCGTRSSTDQLQATGGGRGVARARGGNGGAGVGLRGSRTEMLVLRLVSQLCQFCPRCPPCARPLSSTLYLRARQSNYYELLGICPDASMKEVKRAFFAKSKELHPDRDPKNPALHNQFVELNEAYRVLSKESSRRHYDSQLSLRGTPPPPRHPSQAPRQAASASASASASSPWSSPDARYWAQFRRVRPEDYHGARQRQQKQNHRVLGYCLLLMLGGMVVHYIAFRKLEQIHRRFMDEKDRVIMALYNESKTKAKARANSARLQQERLQKPQSPPPQPGE